MSNSSEFPKQLICASHALLLAAVIGSMSGCSTASKTPTSSSESQAQLMFVQSAEDLKVDSSKKIIRLVNVNPQTLYFSDRPVRIAGHYTMADYLEAWKQGKDNFGEDPPNATLSVYEPDKRQQTMAVIEITSPVVDGADLQYTYKIIEGAMPPSGGATALFIDWIGAGGGVGPGYHGVGAGARGVGVRPGVGAGGPGVGGPRGIGW